MSPRIRIAMVVNDLNFNGISTVVMNYCREINLDTFKISILAGAPVERTYQEECESMGVELIELPSRKKSSRAYYFAFNHAITKGHYNIVHVHGNSATITIELAIAWFHGIKVRIAHSHTCTCNHMRAHNFLLPLFKRLYTNGFACSLMAGNWLFGEGCFDIIPNGFDTRQYIFNPIDRDNIKKELDLEDKFVIGHIGRFNHVKNQFFLLEVFELIAADYDNVVLLLVGDGPDLKKVKDKADRSQYSSRIIIYGESSKTERLYSGMDMFAFPSRYEGLGISMLEAQISGLPCVSSDTVPREVVLCPNVHFLPIEEKNIETWKEQIIDIMLKEYERENVFEMYREYISKYNIADCARSLERKYMELVK